MAATRAQTRANYDRLSGWYDLLAGGSERKFRDLALHALAVQPGERVLEIGPGTGQALVTLARDAGAEGFVCGLDLSPGMCGVARQRCAARQHLSHAGVVCGDAAALPFPGGAFDALFMSFTLELFEPRDMTQVLAECRRVLRAGGRVVAATMAQFGPPNPVERAYGWAHRRFGAWVDCRPIPVAGILAEHGFLVAGVTRGSMWGLGVAIAAAHKGPDDQAA